jgi:hypothetical protein
MQKPAQIRAIYAELRNCLGPEVPSGDLLRIANLILTSYVDVRKEDDDFDSLPEHNSLETLEVDVAIDAGWRIVIFECERARNVDDLEPLDQALLCWRLEEYLGPEWRQHLLLKASDTLYRPTPVARGGHVRGSEGDNDGDEGDDWPGGKENDLKYARRIFKIIENRP